MILATVRKITAASWSPSRATLHGTQEYLRRKAYVKQLAGETLKRLGAAALRQTGLPVEGPILLRHDVAGRPFLCADASGMVLFQPGFCSLSHSGDTLLAVVSDGPVGCDIEHLLRADYPLQALAGFFSEADLRSLPKSDDRDALRLALTRLWTRKEAVYKLAGRMPRDQLWLSDGERTRTMLGISFEERILKDGLVITIALKEIEASVRWINFPD